MARTARPGLVVAGATGSFDLRGGMTLRDYEA